MNLRPMLLINAVLIIAMALVSAWMWDQLPPQVIVPLAWELVAGKRFILMLMPVFAAALTLLFWLGPYLEPRRENMMASVKYWNAMGVLVAGLVTYSYVLLLLRARELSFDVMGALAAGFALLFVGMGNYLTKTRSTWLGGIPTPWAMSSEYAWEKSHRWAGRLFFVSGVATLVAAFALGGMLAMYVLLAGSIVSVLGGAGLSYIYWKNDPDRTNAKQT